MDKLDVGKGTKVTLHFSLKLENGDIVDSNFDKQPATFVFGDGNLLQGFEESLIGLQEGDNKSITVGPEKGFGQPNPNNVQEIERSSFDSTLELSEGLVLSFADAAGGERPGVVKSFDDEFVSIDFNHPLAGRTIIFDVQILDVEPSVTH